MGSYGNAKRGGLKAMLPFDVSYIQVCVLALMKRLLLDIVHPHLVHSSGHSGKPSPECGFEAIFGVRCFHFAHEH